MACLLVCKLPELGAVTLAKSTEMRREEHTAVFSLFHSHVFFFLHQSLSSPTSSAFVVSISFSSFFLLPSAHPDLSLCFVSSSQANPFLILHSFLYFEVPPPLPHYSLFLVSLLICLVVFASFSLFSNKIKWCDMIHFHVFLRSLESRVPPDLNLHVRERI